MPSPRSICAKMRAVDTNVLVRLLARDEPRQLALAEAYIAKGAWVSHVVLIEALWVLRRIYGLDEAQLSLMIEMLLAHGTLNLERSSDIEEALQTFRRKPSLGFADCLIIQSAIAAGHVPFGTFDAGLAKLNGAERIV